MSKILQFNIIIDALNLTKTDYEILKILIKYKSGLLISEIIENIKRSERNVRKRINVLIEKGFLKKNFEVLENKRLAYRYSLENEKKFLQKVHYQISNKIEELSDILLQINKDSIKI